MDLSLTKVKDFRLLFISDNSDDLNLANDILIKNQADTDELDELIEDLNSVYRNWHFFMKDCRIKRIALRSLVDVVLTE